jgi:hypothetical protein
VDETDDIRGADVGGDDDAGNTARADATEAGDGSWGTIGSIVWPREVSGVDAGRRCVKAVTARGDDEVIDAADELEAAESLEPRTSAAGVGEISSFAVCR